ncbi:hypothetical protein Aple_032450 [Acrocarpospora pleiomorpha]|uniref:Diacylglycerol glucosyltransferase N-terminal domain-containing protein n=1 Tax=Acrocarpospora pleiomorpha TaxID=90975 RepID=A0A5M3XJK9_9ACTN|nr:hypothetical protein [Acrocarpospora pleiomorpha]GES20349.1 hypothetical protein Aple_032450 [Acrocarpospora pleiomorpha]
MTRRLLILSASMGAGHDQVAAELARRLGAEGADVEIIDVLHLLPFRLGVALRRSYHWMIKRAPWLYEVIYQVFFLAKRAPSVSPLTGLMAARLSRELARRPPVEVVSTFHLAAQVAGRLRRRGRLRAPSTVLITDFAVHRLWLHPGNDRVLTLNPAARASIAAATGLPAFTCAPVVAPAFRDRTAEPGDRLVLVSSGSWGVGRLAETARVLAGSGYTPVVLCGRDARLRRTLAGSGAGVVLGWRDDMPGLMAAACALVDNGAGLTCVEAFAAGLPVIIYRPIAGHGRDCALAMARAGVAGYARDAAALLDALDRLRDERPRVALASALFASAPAEAVLISAPGGRPAPEATARAESCPE